jgi:Thermostable hemolysin
MSTGLSLKGRAANPNNVSESTNQGLSYKALGDVSAARRSNGLGSSGNIRKYFGEARNKLRSQTAGNWVNPTRWPVGEMLKTSILTIDHPRRHSAEDFIKTVYAARYGARLETFPSRIIALLGNRDEVLCAAGLRFFDDGFFSERYLDTPIEDAVSAISARPVNRSAIFEVTTLASRAPLATTEFIAEIGAFGEEAGFEWSFFTLTRRLYLMVRRLGIALTYLAEADQGRIADSERWGTYYASQPRVYAVVSRRLMKSWDAEQYAAAI